MSHGILNTNEGRYGQCNEYLTRNSHQDSDSLSSWNFEIIINGFCIWFFCQNFAVYGRVFTLQKKNKYRKSSYKLNRDETILVCVCACVLVCFSFSITYQLLSIRGNVGYNLASFGFPSQFCFTFSGIIHKFTFFYQTFIDNCGVVFVQSKLQSLPAISDFQNIYYSQPSYSPVC